MRVRFLVAGVGALLLTACIDAGPQTNAQVQQDIRSVSWTRGAIAPDLPGLRPPAETYDQSERALP